MLEYEQLGCACRTWTHLLCPAHTQHRACNGTASCSCMTGAPAHEAFIVHNMTHIEGVVSYTRTHAHRTCPWRQVCQAYIAWRKRCLSVLAIPVSYVVHPARLSWLCVAFSESEARPVKRRKPLESSLTPSSMAKPKHRGELQYVAGPSEVPVFEVGRDFLRAPEVNPVQLMCPAFAHFNNLNSPSSRPPPDCIDCAMDVSLLCLLLCLLHSTSCHAVLCVGAQQLLTQASV